MRSRIGTVAAISAIAVAVAAPAVVARFPFPVACPADRTDIYRGFVGGQNSRLAASDFKRLPVYHPQKAPL
jgi:hypothetical protein